MLCFVLDYFRVLFLFSDLEKVSFSILHLAAQHAIRSCHPAFCYELGRTLTKLKPFLCQPARCPSQAILRYAKLCSQLASFEQQGYLVMDTECFHPNIPKFELISGLQTHLLAPQKYTQYSAENDDKDNAIPLSVWMLDDPLVRPPCFRQRHAPFFSGLQEDASFYNHCSLSTQTLISNIAQHVKANTPNVSALQWSWFASHARVKFTVKTWPQAKRRRRMFFEVLSLGEAKVCAFFIDMPKASPPTSLAQLKFSLGDMAEVAVAMLSNRRQVWDWLTARHAWLEDCLMHVSEYATYLAGEWTRQGESDTQSIAWEENQLPDRNDMFLLPIPVPEIDWSNVRIRRNSSKIPWQAVCSSSASSTQKASSESCMQTLPDKETLLPSLRAHAVSLFKQHKQMDTETFTRRFETRLSQAPLFSALLASKQLLSIVQTTFPKLCLQLIHVMQSKNDIVPCAREEGNEEEIIVYAYRA